MSSAAAWANQNTATVEPYLGTDTFNGGTMWGEPYQIACTWTGQSDTVRMQGDDQAIIEYVANNIIWTEDNRPKRGDRITLNAQSEAAAQPQIIQDVTEWDASPLGEIDRPDFRLVV